MKQRADPRESARKLFRVVLLGYNSVGKSGIFSRMVKDHFSPRTAPTIDVQAEKWNTLVDGREIALAI
jgi:GTPase SAR1 family protein